MTERHGTTKGAGVFLDVASVRVPELDLARFETPVRREPKDLQHDHGEELDFVDGDRELMLDFVDANRMAVVAFFQREDPSVRQELLVAEARERERLVGPEGVVDLNDRALRNIITGLGTRFDGRPRESGFDISVASEVMAVLAMAADRKTSSTPMTLRTGRSDIRRTGPRCPPNRPDLPRSDLADQDHLRGAGPGRAGLRYLDRVCR